MFVPVLAIYLLVENQNPKSLVGTWIFLYAKKCCKRKSPVMLFPFSLHISPVSVFAHRTWRAGVCGHVSLQITSGKSRPQTCSCAVLQNLGLVSVCEPQLCEHKNSNASFNRFPEPVPGVYSVSPCVFTATNYTSCHESSSNMTCKRKKQGN